MAANNMSIPEAAAFRGFNTETQSAADGNHNFSQLLTSLSNVDKSQNNSSGGTNPQVNLSGEIDRISQSPSLDHSNIEITDFSPEWDYTTGGSKVLICINPPLTHVFNNQLL